jgi:hypothetical protein
MVKEAVVAHFKGLLTAYVYQASTQFTLELPRWPYFRVQQWLALVLLERDAHSRVTPCYRVPRKPSRSSSTDDAREGM